MRAILRAVGPRGVAINAQKAYRAMVWPLIRRGFSEGGNREARRLRWIFILGCNNSGTSILYRSLSLHPAISTLPQEGHKLSGALPHPDRHGCPRLWTECPEVFRLTDRSANLDCARLVYDWTGWRRKPGATFIMEKSPPDTIRSLWLQQVFGDCHFIGILRNGYAVSAGIRRRNGYAIERCARHWARANEIMLRDAESLRNFRPIKYEEMVADPKGTLEGVAKWLDIDAESFEDITGQSFVTHHRDSTPGRIADFNARALAGLSATDRKGIEREAGEMLQRLGYLDPMQ